MASAGCILLAVKLPQKERLLTISLFQDFNELADMAGRGKSFKVDVMSGDLTDKCRVGDDWYNVWEGEAVLCTLGKLGEDQYKGMNLMVGYTQVVVLGNQYIITKYLFPVIILSLNYLR